MYVFSRLFTPRGFGSRFLVGALLASVLFFNSVGSLFASGTTGGLTGTVTNAQNQGLPGVKVSAVAATARYATTTNGSGFYSFVGVTPDTYTVSFELTGYQAISITGVNVFPDQTAEVPAQLQKSLVTIGRVYARSVGGAFQPANTNDTYTYTADQIKNELGKSFAPAESSLIVTLPGASNDSSGYPVIRGGRENEEGFQYEGIPYTDAFTNQFVNSLAINSGVGSFQLTPGVGDASIQSPGTGTLNLISKRGSRPAFGTLDFESRVWPFDHQFGFEYGWASPDGRWSNYTALLAQNRASVYQAHNADTTRIGAFFSRAFQTGRSFTDNFVYKFGRDLNQSVQIFYANDQYNFYFNVGGLQGLFYPSGDAFGLANLRAFSGMSNAQIQSLITLFPGQPSPTANLVGPNNVAQPNDTFKVQYSNNLDAATFLTAKFYKVNSTAIFGYPTGGGQSFVDIYSPQGGQNTGVALDVTRQLNSKNLLKAGGFYGFLHPIDTCQSGVFGFLAATGFGAGGEGYDFLPPAQAAAFGFSGYVYNAFNGAPPSIPPFLQDIKTNRQEWGAYINDTFSPTDRLKIDLGARVDGANLPLPSITPCNTYASTAGGALALTVDATSMANQCLYFPNAFNASGQPIVTIDKQAKNPVVLEPRAAFSWQISKNDAVRFSYGRSVEFPPIADVSSQVSRTLYQGSGFGAIAADGNAGNICGVRQNAPCANLGEQLYWDNQISIDGIPIQPVKPETFSNFDFSYSHQFPGNIGFKVTPFYRRGYDALTLIASIKTDASGNPLLTASGNLQFNPPQATNLGIERTTGLEVLVTRDLAYGLSGTLSATYINELSNVAPLSSSEDFFPTVQPANLALGNLYRVGFLSPFQATLALQYKMRSGLRINPIISYNHGYPIGNGLISGVFVNNVARNVPSTNAATQQGTPTTPAGASGAMQYVDPMNPGSIFRPNIDAIRGPAMTSSAGGMLSHARTATDLDIEFNPPGSRNTFGVFVSNLFSQVYGQPAINSRWQPVASGIGGPKTGTTAAVLAFPNFGFANYANDRFGYDPFIITPNGAPTRFQLYYQVAL